MSETKHFMELGFTVVAEPNEYHVDYTVYDHDGVNVEDNSPRFHRRGATSSPDMVESINDAEIFLHGYVKWDGCSNWYFDEQKDGMMLHGCYRLDVLRFGLILAECWDWTKDLCPAWDGNKF